jgi:tripartite tricarboxylate transporter TctB family protein
VTGPRRLHLGELLIDAGIVAGSAFYLHAASAYPPQGRQIPTVVGWLALGLGVLHLVAHAVPRLWEVTHDSAARGRKTAAVTAVRAAVGASAVTAAAPAGAGPGTRATDPDGPASGPDDAMGGASGGPGDGPGEDAGDGPVAPVGLDMPQGEPRQVMLAIAWVVALLVAVYALGFELAVPVFFLAYFGVMRSWRTAAVSAVVMWAVTKFLFVNALGVPLPHGWL